jgi:hypothetical protein
LITGPLLGSDGLKLPTYCRYLVLGSSSAQPPH